MSRHPGRARRAAAAVGLAGIATYVGCARNAAPAAGDSSAARAVRAARADATVFTDTALFRRVCAEADSGLTPAVGRCTPRDQGRQLRPDPPPR